MLFTVKIMELDTKDEVSRFIDRGQYDIRGYDSMDLAGEAAKDEAMKSQAHGSEIAGRMMLYVKAVALKTKPDDILNDMQPPAKKATIVTESAHSDSEGGDEQLALTL